jgi:hypothetical protein
MSNSAETSTPSAIAQTLDQVDAFLRRYLVCSAQQRTILALWVAHTYCFNRFPVTPYLEIYSPEKQSGKTVCLRLLKLLCNHPWLPVGINASRLVIRIASCQPTLLLDNWDTVFRASGSQSIVGFLDAGATQGSYYSFNADNNYSDFPVFCPKAFAGHQRLPAPLADRCFPILLRRLKNKEQVLPFWEDVASNKAYGLAKSLRSWAEENHDLLREVALRILGSPVLGLSVARNQLMAPLMAIATIAGGKWPRKLGCARFRIVAASLAQPPSIGLQLLTDIRSFFSLNNDPPRIHTAPLLEYLNALEDRPWKKLTPIACASFSRISPSPVAAPSALAAIISKDSPSSISWKAGSPIFPVSPRSARLGHNQLQIRLAQARLRLAPAALRLAQAGLRSAQSRVRLAQFGIPKPTTPVIATLAFFQSKFRATEHFASYPEIVGQKQCNNRRDPVVGILAWD